MSRPWALNKNSSLFGRPMVSVPRLVDESNTDAAFVVDQNGRLRWLSTEAFPSALSETMLRQIRRLLQAG